MELIPIRYADWRPRKLPLQILFFMKWNLILLCLFLQVSAGTYSQQITISIRNATLEKVFSEIERQSGYTVWYEKEYIAKLGRVDIDLKEATIEKTLDVCLKDQPLSYSIVARMIVIRKKEIEKSPNPPAPAVFKGRVVNEKGEPMAGASVLVKGTNRGVSTDRDGTFELKDIDERTIIVVSFTGYESQEIKIESKAYVLISLTPIPNTLDQTVVIAYGTTTRRLNAGNVSTISAETISQQPVSNPLEAMEGRAPGLNITQQTGVPGGGFTVQIRGLNSISSGNDPLYLVDGVPYTSTLLSNSNVSGQILVSASPLNAINPSDIESIEILKDADATAIYGSRGANGVVLITTKKGKAGRTKVDLNAYTGFGTLQKRMDLLGTKDYLQMRHEAFANDGALPDAGSAPDLVSWDTTRYTDWQKALIGGTARYSDFQGSVSGGDPYTQFLIGGGYHKETTVFPGDLSDQKVSGHFNLSHHSADQRLKLQISANYITDNNNLIIADLTGAALSLAPVAPPAYDSAGHLNWANASWSNPYAILQQKFKASTDNLFSNISLSYTILPGLDLKFTGGYNQTNYAELNTTPSTSINPAYSSFLLPNSIRGTTAIKTWIAEPQAVYSRKLGEGTINILAGGTFQQTATNQNTLYLTGFASDALLEDLQAATSIFVLSDNSSVYRYDAFFGRISYNLRDKLIVNLNGRRDGSSRFGPGKQFANFGSLGAAWIFSKEDWVKRNLSFLSFGKLRASYGLTGNDQIGDYQYLQTYSPTIYPYQGAAGLFPTRLFNPDYAWETNRKLEAGLEMGLVRERVFVSASYYHNISDNQLVGYPLSLVTGFNSVIANLPARVLNEGWEFLATLQIIRTKNFSWSLSANATIPSNKLLSFPGLASSSYANIYEVGQPLTIVKAFHYTGVDPATGIYQTVDAKGNPTFNPSYPDDLYAIKKIDRDFYGGIQNSITWKGFRLDFFFQVVRQTGRNYQFTFALPGTMNNEPTLVMGRWQKPGEISSVQRFSQAYGFPPSNQYYTSYGPALSDLSIGNASFVRLKNLSLSYQFKSEWLQRNHLGGFSVYVHALNLWTISRYTGLDPETIGVQGGVLPPLRIITAGIQVSL